MYPYCAGNDAIAGEKDTETRTSTQKHLQNRGPQRLSLTALTVKGSGPLGSNCNWASVHGHLCGLGIFPSAENPTHLLGLATIMITPELDGVKRKGIIFGGPQWGPP